MDTKVLGPESQVLLVDPMDGTVKTVFQSGYAPDVAVSPDGRRLYVAYTDQTARQEKLSIFDTSSGQLIRAVDNPHRLRWDWDPPGSFLAISTDGRYLYALKRRTIQRGHDDYWVETFDTARAMFLRVKAPVPDCAGAFLFPSSANQLQVVCGGPAVVYSVRFTDTGALSSVIPIQVPPPTPVLRGGQKSMTGEIEQAVLDASRGVLILVKRDFRLWKVDLTSREMNQTQADPVLSGRQAMAQQGAFSPDGNQIYVPVTSTGERGKWANQIAVFDTLSLKPLRIMTPSAPFLNLAISRDGRQLYATVPERGSVLVLDAATGSQARALQVGTTPAFILVAP